MTLRRTPLNGRRAPLERRTGLDTSGGGLRRRAPMPRSSGRPADVPPSPARRRRAALDVPAETRALLRARSGGRCEAVLPVTGCTSDATDVHHRQRRREGGHALPNLLDLCRTCHAWAHAHPAAARAVGAIVSVYEDPADVGVLVLSRLTGSPRLVHLDELGGYR